MKLYISKIAYYLKTCKNSKKIDIGIKEFLINLQSGFHHFDEIPPFGRNDNAII